MTNGVTNSWFSAAPARTSAGKRIHHAQALESAEVAIAGHEFRDTVFQAQNGNVSIVNQVPGSICLANDLIEQRNMSIGLGKQQKRRRSDNTAQISKRDFQRDRRMKDARVRNNSEEFVKAGPWDRPGSRSLGEIPHQLESRGVMLIRFHFGRDQDVRVNGLHRSPPVHQVEKCVAVHKIDSRHFTGLPALEVQLVSRAGRRRQSLAQEVVGKRLESSPLFRRFFLQSAEKSIVNRQGGSPHMQKHTVDASRCQRLETIDDGPVAREAPSQQLISRIVTCRRLSGLTSHFIRAGAKR